MDADEKKKDEGEEGEDSEGDEMGSGDSGTEPEIPEKSLQTEVLDEVRGLSKGWWGYEDADEKATEDATAERLE